MRLFAHILIWLVAVVALGTYGVWCAMPHFLDDPAVFLEKQTPVRTFLDAGGNVLLREATYEGQWRYHVPLEKISAVVPFVIQHIEDARFYEHDGIDRHAVFRALFQLFRNCRIISGASTISMQLAGAHLPRKRTFGRKLLQAAYARRLEWSHSKHWILEQYLNRIHFGGNVYGVEAASWMYFGLPASDLNIAEATLLSGLPQRPNGLRPDRHPDAARSRQLLMLRLLVMHGDISWQEAWNTYMNTPLRYRDFKQPSPLKIHRLPRTEHIIRLAAKEAPEDSIVHTTLDISLQELLRSALRQGVNSLAGVNDGAGIIVDNASGEVLALVGTLNFDSPNAGQVNAATAKRAAGSTLKPFVYAEAVDAGLICPDTILHDTPIRFGTYAPGNYDGTYKNGVTAAEALSLSLNTPAVRLTASLGVKRVIELFQRLRIEKWDGWRNNAELANKLGLSLIFGTGGYRLTDLARAYLALTNRGIVRPIHFTKMHKGTLPVLRTTGVVDTQAFTPGAAAIVTQMLSSRSLPGAPEGIAWKTGTSTANQDAWCFGYSPDITVGIWLGNKSGKTSPALVGATAAAPVVASLFQAYYRDAPVPEFALDADTRKIKVCTKTGLRATLGCKSTHVARIACDVPLVPCRSCGIAPANVPSLLILKPEPKRYVAGKNGVVNLRLQVRPAENVHWYINDKYIGILPANTRRDFTRGHYSLRAVSEDPGVNSTKVEFTVE